MADQLLDELRTTAPAGLNALITAFGRQLVGLAFLVLEHNVDAQRAAAHALADGWQRAPDANRAQLHAALLHGTLRHALRLREASTTVDPDLYGSTIPALRSLSPALRVAVALQVRDGMEPDAVARILNVDPGELASVIATCGVVPLRAAVARALDGIPVLVDEAMVRAAIAAPPTASRHRWAIPAGLGSLGLVLLLIAVTDGQTPAPSALPVAVVASEAPSAPAPAPIMGRTEVAPFTLASCQLAPVDSPLAYAGWLTKADLGIGDGVDEGAAVYALVTRGPADWQGRPTLGYPSYPVAAGQMGCAFDPADGSFAAIGLRDGWLPPVAGDGCARSPSSEYGGYRELGGPGAFVVPSVGPGTFRADDADGQLLVRIAPRDEPVTSVNATLAGPDGNGRVEARVATETVATAVTTSSWYLWLKGIRVPAPGCWTLNITVDSAVVGVATLPFSAPN